MEVDIGYRMCGGRRAGQWRGGYIGQWRGGEGGLVSKKGGGGLFVSAGVEKVDWSAKGGGIGQWRGGEGGIGQ